MPRKIDSEPEKTITEKADVVKAVKKKYECTLCHLTFSEHKKALQHVEEKHFRIKDD